MKPNIIYLHGFASSPKSQKAQAFKGGFESLEIGLQIPDLNKPSFERLTLTAILSHIAGVVRMCPPGPVYLVGSSMGGLAAAQFVHHYRDAEAKRVELLFLLAPALDMISVQQAKLGQAQLNAWKAGGWHAFHHYGTNTTRQVHYGFMQDLATYDSFTATVDIPVVIYHGSNDESVPLEQSRRFAEPRNNIQLRVVESDHSLLDQLDVIWKDMVDFFAL